MITHTLQPEPSGRWSGQRQAQGGKVPKHNYKEQRTQPHAVQCFSFYFKIVCSYITYYHFSFPCHLEFHAIQHQLEPTQYLPSPADEEHTTCSGKRVYFFISCQCNIEMYTMVRVCHWMIASIDFRKNKRL